MYGENARKIVPIDSAQFGRVMAVCIGAMMVGTIKTTVEEGQQVRRGQEFGYFAFGVSGYQCIELILTFFYVKVAQLLFSYLRKAFLNGTKTC